MKSKWIKKEKKEYEINNGKPMPPDYRVLEINSYMITEKDIMDNPNMTGDYNVDRYIAIFNKRIEPLLVVFKPEMREDILIDDPKNRQYFTKQQCEMTNGYPLKPENQDNLDEVLTLSDSEVLFWNKMGIDPYFMYVENSINEIDNTWVEYNRSLLNSNTSHVKNNEDEIFDNVDSDNISHAIFV
jgi:hypothetical protein